MGTIEVIDKSKYEGGVFADSAIETINLPSTLKRIESMTFCECCGLKNIEIPDGVEYIGKECFKYSAIEMIKLPSKLKTIEAKIFFGCKNLKSIEIPNGVERIEEGCFGNSYNESKIEEVTLPNTLKKIDKDVFYCCPNLRTVWVEEDCMLAIKKYVNDSVEIISIG